MTFTSFPLETAAERLGVTAQTLAEWLRRHPRDASGRAFFGRMGKAKLFTEDEIARISAALRRDAPCSKSILPGKARRPGAFGAPMGSDSVAAALTLVRELTNAKRLKRTSEQLKRRS